MPLIARKKVILAKIETTYGTDAAPTGAANAILARNVNLNPLEQDTVDRNLQRPYLGGNQKIPTGSRVVIDFEVEIQGSGTAGTAPAWGPLMRACGHSETIVASTSVTYAPISTGFEAISIYMNVDGVLHKLTGARGTFTKSMPNKDIPVLKLTFTGLWNNVTDTAAPVPTYTPWKDPLPVTNINTTPFTLHGISPVMSELSFDMGGTLVHRALVGGTEQVLITDRNSTGSITIEATTIAVKDWFSVAKAATLGALSITHGTVAGSKVTFAAPKVQLDAPAYSDMDGIQMIQMGLSFIPNTGGDEYTIVCT